MTEIERKVTKAVTEFCIEDLKEIFKEKKPDLLLRRCIGYHCAIQSLIDEGYIIISNEEDTAFLDSWIDTVSKLTIYLICSC